jgi:NAD(P)-dependent dehydrogenase (short-subunit alcohol dehydrogenase family)
VAYPISYRQLEEMMDERGVEVDHSTLNRWLAIELAGKGIRVNAVSPDVIKTPMHPQEAYPFLASLHPVGRMGEIQDIVEAVLFLEKARFVTGEILHVDGGANAGRR